MTQGFTQQLPIPLPVTKGGTGVTTSTGTGDTVLNISPTLVTPLLGTPTSGVLTNCTGFDWDFISSATASNSASVSFTGLTSTYRVYKVILTNIVPQNDAVSIRLRTSTDNGGSYSSGASDYAWALLYHNTSAASAFLGTAATSQIAFGGNGIGNAANEMCSAEISMYTPSSAQYFRVSWTAVYLNSTTVLYAEEGCGQRLSAADVDAIQFSMGSGNIVSGEFRLYGIRDI